MATYLQWAKALEAGRLKRLTWACGDPRLVHEATALAQAASGLRIARVPAGQVPESEVWDRCLQLPSLPGAGQLVVVRSAQRLRQWQVLEEIAAQGAEGQHLLFLSDDTDYYKRDAVTGRVATSNLGAKIMLPGPAIVNGCSQGQVVKCVLAKDEDRIAWLRRREPSLTANVAWMVLARTGHDLSLAASAAAQVALWPPEEHMEALVHALVPAEPGEEFADLLARGRKPQALLAAPQGEEVGKAIGWLGSILDSLAELYAAQQPGASDPQARGVPRFLAARYKAAAREYPPSRVRGCRMLLASCDDAYRRGAREALAETLAALW